MAMTIEPIRFTDGAGYDRWMWAVAMAPSRN